MRLIDADALKTPIEDRIDNIPASEYDNGWNNAIYAVIDEIDNAPTVEDRTREVLSLQETIRKLTKERPHGDLISRDALKKDIDFQYICECCHNNGNTCDICPVAEIEKKIDDAPTIEEKSYAMGLQDGLEDGLQGIRPEGKWIYHRAQGEFLPYMECDNCHEEFLLNMLRPAEFRKVNRFCSNCGADMRGKKHG